MAEEKLVNTPLSPLVPDLSLQFIPYRGNVVL